RGGVAIDGATGKTYVTATAAVTHSITVAVTGSKLGYDTTTQTSDPLTVTPKTAGATGQVRGTAGVAFSHAMGGAAFFGAFTPGLAQTYTTATTATVTSTAG